MKSGPIISNFEKESKKQVICLVWLLSESEHYSIIRHINTFFLGVGTV